MFRTPCHSLVRVEVQVLYHLFTGEDGMGATELSIVFDCIREVTGQKCPVLAGCPSPPLLSLGGKVQRRFCWNFFFCTHWCFQVATFSSTQYRIYKTRKKTQGTQCHVISHVPKFLADLVSSLLLSESSYVYFIYNVLCFQLDLTG